MVRRFSVMVLFFAAIAFLASVIPASAAPPDIKEGKWEITTNVEMPGMPEGMSNHTFTHTQCLTSDHFVPKGSQNQSGQECRMEDVQTSGDTVTWKMHCKTPQGDVDGEGRITYSGDTFEGRMKMRLPSGEMTHQMKGRYVGPCD